MAFPQRPGSTRSGTFSSGRRLFLLAARASKPGLMEAAMHGLIYLIGLIVVIMAILSFFGLR